MVDIPASHVSFRGSIWRKQKSSAVLRYPVRFAKFNVGRSTLSRPYSSWCDEYLPAVYGRLLVRGSWFTERYFELTLNNKNMEHKHVSTTSASDILYVDKDIHGESKFAGAFLSCYHSKEAPIPLKKETPLPQKWTVLKTSGPKSHTRRGVPDLLIFQMTCVLLVVGVFSPTHLKKICAVVKFFTLHLLEVYRRTSTNKGVATT